jgi:hypothetical protein
MKRRRSKGAELVTQGRRRPSKSADGARAAMIAEELAMTPLERMKLALQLGRFYGRISGDDER